MESDAKSTPSTTSHRLASCGFARPIGKDEMERPSTASEPWHSSSGKKVTQVEGVYLVPCHWAAGTSRTVTQTTAYR